MVKEFHIYIGLLKSDMKTSLQISDVLEKTQERFNVIGVNGFNSQIIKGVWKNQQEDCLYISFINSFEVPQLTVVRALELLKVDLEQESILVKLTEVVYNFI